MIIIFAAALIILLGVFAFNSDMMSSVTNQFKYKKARAALDDIGDMAEMVYQQGVGSKTKVYIALPGSINSTSVEDQTISISFTGTDHVVYRNFGFTVNGSLSTNEGFYWVSVEAFDEYVLIGLAQDDTAPEACCGSPTSTYDTTPLISVTSNEPATCRGSGSWGDGDESYEDMDFDFTGTGSSHSYQITSELSIATHTVYVRCNDTNGNVATSSYSWNIQIVEDMPPLWVLINATLQTLFTGNEDTFYSQWTDDFGLSRYVFSWNGSISSKYSNETSEELAYNGTTRCTTACSGDEPSGGVSGNYNATWTNDESRYAGGYNGLNGAGLFNFEFEFNISHLDMNGYENISWYNLTLVWCYNGGNGSGEWTCNTGTGINGSLDGVQDVYAYNYELEQWDDIGNLVNTSGGDTEQTAYVNWSQNAEYYVSTNGTLTTRIEFDVDCVNDCAFVIDYAGLAVNYMSDYEDYEYVSNTTTWLYDDTNTNNDDGWENTSFDDSGWSSSASYLGFGEAGLSVNITSGYMTYYFRNSFYVDDTAKITNITFKIDFDDGFIGYLNGNEFLRSNVSDNGHDTPAYNHESNLGGGNDWTIYGFNVTSLPYLINGTNTLAIEVHNNGTASSDLAFRANLIARRKRDPCGVWTNETSASFVATNWTNTTRELGGMCGMKTVGYRFHANDTQNKWNDTPIQTIYVNETVVVPPSETSLKIALIDPVDEYPSTSGDMTFQYNVSGSGGSEISSCSLLINRTVVVTNTSITENVTQEFYYNNMLDANYNWSVNCTNDASVTNSSDNWRFNTTTLHDIIIATAGDDVYWYDNNGWTQYAVEENIESQDINSVVIGDLDNDYRNDAVLGKVGADIYYYNNTGGADSGTWSGRGIIRQNVDSTVNGIDIGDIDGDGTLDIVAGSDATDVLWFPNNGSSPWETQTIIADAGADVNNVKLGDIDNDTALDVVVVTDDQAGGPNALVVWYNNTGSWSATTIGSPSDDRIMGLDVGDIDSDNDLDVVIGTDGETIIWYENGNSWAATTVVVDTVSDTNRVKLGDLDGDDDLDIVAVTDDRSGGPNARVLWYENGNSWAETEIAAPSDDNIFGLALYDLDNDNDLDVIIGNHAEDVIWYENGNAWAATTIDADALGDVLWIEVGPLN